MPINRRCLPTAFASLAAPAIAQPGIALAFTAIPDQDETLLVERFGRVAAYLQDRLAVPVRYVPVESYPAAVTALASDQVQLAWFGGFSRTITGPSAATWNSGSARASRSGCAALLERRDPAILAPFGRSGFIAAANADDALVEQVALATVLLN